MTKYKRSSGGESGGTSVTAELERLAMLRQHGMLTDRELRARMRQQSRPTTPVRRGSPWVTMVIGGVILITVTASASATAGFGAAPRPVPMATVQSASASASQEQQAVAFAARLIRVNACDGWCLKFVADAWANAGIHPTGSATAFTYWSSHPNDCHQHASPGSFRGAPEGALLFWGPYPWSSAGQIAIAADGSGDVISTSAYPYYGGIRSDPRVFEFTMRSRSASTFHCLGWTMPGDSGAGSTAPAPASPPAPKPAPVPAPTPSPPATSAPVPVPVGTTISDGVTVQIACKTVGFAVADRDAWWYRISQSPWDNGSYVPADVFYNNGSTSGSLLGTPFVDPQVPVC